MADRIQIRRDTAANWASANPVLAIGEQGYETDTGKMKIGNGSSTWNTLSYFADTASLDAATLDGLDSTDFATAAQGALADSAIQSADLATVATTGSYNDLSDQPSIPSITGLATETYVDTAVSNLVDTAPDALNTLNELAAALNDDADFAGTVTTSLAAKANTADLATVATTGAYSDLTGTPTIPADVSDLTDTTSLLGGGGGGGSFEAVASGSLSDGSTVVLNSDGTVAAVAQEVSAALLHTLQNPNPYGTRLSDQFGGKTAISDNYAIVSGEYEDDAGGTESGRVYIYNTSTGALVRTLDDPNDYGTSAGDQFGSSVAISGDYAIVGAYLEDDAGGTQSGKAYIFNVTTGALLHTLDNPNPYGTSEFNYFGYSAGISGNYAIVGAYYEGDAGGTQSGKAYIFNVTTGALVHTLDNPNAYGTSDGDRFGYSVAMSGDYAIVGANDESNFSGKAYIFNVTTGALLHTLDNPNADVTSASDSFGSSVAISGDYAIVGAYQEDDAGGTSSGKAYIYNVTTGALLHTLNNPNAYDTSANDQFSGSVDISGDYAIVGARYEGDAGGTSSGKAYVFNVTTGALVYTYDNPNDYDTSASDYFGGSVSISDNYLIVGAIGEDNVGIPSGLSSGRAYIFNVPATTTNLTAENYAGIADAAYADAATATIQTAGSVDDAQSGLTPGQAYYVQADGTLGLTPDTPSVFAGTAVSATSLLIGKEAPASTIAYADVTGTPTLATVATTGSYNDLSDQPSIPSITGLATETYVDTAVSNLVDTAPDALNTLNELAAALNDDADFAGTVTTSLAAKANSADLATVATSGSYNDLTDQPAGGGSFEAVASGSLSDGSTVVLNADGTVSVVSSVVSLAGAGTAFEFEPNYVTDYVSVSDTYTGKIAIFWRDFFAGTTFSQVGTISGSSISFGPKVTSPNGYPRSATFDSNSNKVVLFYYPATVPQNLSAVVCTISGSSISFGSAVAVDTTGKSYAASTFDTSTNKVVVTYGTDSGDGELAKVGTISGNSISFGSETTVSTGGIARFTRVAFDSNSNKVVVIYSDSTNGSYGTAIVGTVSGTSISFGTSVVYSSSSIANPSICFDNNSNKIVVAYSDSTNGAYGTAIVGTVSGTSISFGAPVVFKSANALTTGLVFDPSINKVLLAFVSSNGSQYTVRVVMGTVSGTSISFGTEDDLNIESDSSASPVYDSASGKVLLFYRDTAQDGWVIPYQTADETTTNLTAENYAGIADAAYADAATATIQTAGSVDDAQSGLTPGQAYYVQADGTLGLTPGTPSVFAGTAVSATKLLIGKEGPAADLSSYATETYVDTAVSNLVDTAPDALNTLNELAAALNDDADFAGTVTTSLSTKLGTDSVIDGGTV